MIKILGIDHVAINVKNIDKSVEFYTKVIGLRITDREPSKPGVEYFLDAGPSLIGIIQADNLDDEHPFSHTGLGANHFSFRVHANDFDSFIQNLEKNNVRIEYAKKRPKSWSLYFYDLDGNKLEVTSWPLEDGLSKDRIQLVKYDPSTKQWKQY
ncbi:MAG: VOC family protein [Candidatus Omnitrophica bacterium]|nr:VOC family protein [Candidatus Omnitrophota bacterium]